MTDQILAEPTAAADLAAGDPSADPGASPYRVLARKYRPTNFAELIGQDALVRTLTNAIESNRTAHAIILTGVRGVGKTTTARIIARGLNCIGPDGSGGPTPQPCGLCEHCRAIGEDRHVDVIEMDAASRTGIDDVRELIEGVRYRPVQARAKVYIIDEVHMLSKQAFNGLLKTLEEPPEYVVFIFATTEIRKVPVTVLSRCQRFDLRRVDQEVLTRHFAGIAKKEGIDVADEALAMIARAADGSVRDGLSLLDQAIALSGDSQVVAEQVRAMLGLADRTRVIDLFEAVMRGAMPSALAILGELHNAGADPGVLLQDMLDLTHNLTRAKLVPEILDDASLPEAERVRGRDLTGTLSLPVLARTWQMLLKGLGEVQAAPSRLQAAEMVLIRLAYASDLPSPAELVERLSGEKTTPAAAPVAPQSSSMPLASPQVSVLEPAPELAPEPPRAPSGSGPQTALAPQIETEIQPEASPDSASAPEPTAALPEVEAPQSFIEIVDMVRARKEHQCANHLVNDVHLVRFEPGRLEIRLNDQASRRLPGQVSEILLAATGVRWVVSVSQQEGEATLAEQNRGRDTRAREEVLAHPLVRAAMETFPGAKLVETRAAPCGAAALNTSSDENGPDGGGQP